MEKQKIPLFDNRDVFWFLRQNVDVIESIGNIYFATLRPVLNLPIAAQLKKVERYNPHIAVHTEEWELLVKRHFQVAQRNATESWREVYARCNSEKDAKLLELADRLRKKRSVMATGRQIQMAFVDTAV